MILSEREALVVADPGEQSHDLLITTCDERKVVDVPGIEDVLVGGHVRLEEALFGDDHDLFLKARLQDHVKLPVFSWIELDLEHLVRRVSDDVDLQRVRSDRQPGEEEPPFGAADEVALRIHARAEQDNARTGDEVPAVIQNIAADGPGDGCLGLNGRGTPRHPQNHRDSYQDRYLPASRKHGV